MPRRPSCDLEPEHICRYSTYPTSCIYVYMYICIYVYMYIYIYVYMYICNISAGPCLSGATRLRSVCCKLQIPSHSNHLNHKLTVKFSSHFHLQSAISSLPVWYWLLALVDQQMGDKLICYCRPGRTVFASPGVELSTWALLGRPLKIISFQLLHFFTKLVSRGLF